jgi:hypothetical protein
MYEQAPLTTQATASLLPPARRISIPIPPAHAPRQPRESATHRSCRTRRGGGGGAARRRGGGAARGPGTSGTSRRARPPCGSARPSTRPRRTPATPPPRRHPSSRPPPYSDLGRPPPGNGARCCRSQSLEGSAGFLVATGRGPGGGGGRHEAVLKLDKESWPAK